jgi:hypothetical protein
MPPSSYSSSAPPNLSSIYSFHTPALNDFAHSTIESCIISLFDGKKYDPTKVVKLSDSLNTSIVETLSQACPNFKYVSTVIISENASRTPQGERNLEVNSTCVWCGDTDDCLDVVWKNDFLGVVVQLFAIAI